MYCTATHLRLMRHRHGRTAGRAGGIGAWVATVQRLHSSCPQTLQPQQQALMSTNPISIQFELGTQAPMIPIGGPFSRVTCMYIIRTATTLTTTDTGNLL